MNSFPELKKLSGQSPLIDLYSNSALIKEIQQLLKLGGFYDGLIDGKLGEKSIAAFKTFKRSAYLEQLDILGKTTVGELLEIASLGTHPVPKDVSAPTVPRGKIIRLPTGESVNCGSLISGSSYFYWGEATKNGTRIPGDRAIAGNIIKLAQYMDMVRDIFGYPIKVTSWYRDPVSNHAAGGVRNSFHLRGNAIDFVVQGVAPLDVYRKLNNWHGARGGLGKHVAFTHLDLRGYSSRFTYG